jgi:hypothetical protein
MRNSSDFSFKPAIEISSNNFMPLIPLFLHLIYIRQGFLSNCHNISIPLVLKFD